MAFRAKPRTVLTEQQAEERLRDVVKFSGDLNSIRMHNRTTVNHERRMFFLALASLVLGTRKEIERKGFSIAKTPERQTEPSHSGAFLKRRA